MTLFTLAVILFLIMDPVGNITSYLKMVKGIAPRKQRWIVMREMGIALLTMIIFNYLGETLFDIFQLSEISLRLTIGVIMFLIALKIIFPSVDSLRANISEEEPFIIPLAIPLIAGPSLLASIMLFAHLESSQAMMLTAILLAWGASALVLLCAQPLHRFLGNNGLLACERLMGMILIMLAIQRFCEGIQQFVGKCVAASS